MDRAQGGDVAPEVLVDVFQHEHRPPGALALVAKEGLLLGLFAIALRRDPRHVYGLSVGHREGKKTAGKGDPRRRAPSDDQDEHEHEYEYEYDGASYSCSCSCSYSITPGMRRSPSASRPHPRLRPSP